MVSWLSICFIVSNATPTTMRIDTPENPTGIAHMAEATAGRMAMSPRKTEPGRVIRLSIRPR